MAKIAKWQHPKTGAVRVYLNNLPMQGSAKVWVERQVPDSFGCEINIRVMSQYHSRGEAGNLANEAEAAINQAAGHRVTTWAELISIAS